MLYEMHHVMAHLPGEKVNNVADQVRLFAIACIRLVGRSAFD